MKENYLEYNLSQKEKISFYTKGYILLFFISYFFYKSIVISLILGFGIVLLKKHYEKYLLKKSKKLLVIQFKDFLVSIEAAVSAGMPTEKSIEIACYNLKSLYGEETIFVKELNKINNSIKFNNEDEKALLLDFAKRTGNVDIINFMQIYLICSNIGGNTKYIVAETNKIIIEKLEIEKEIDTITSQKIYEGRIIAVMPFAIILFLNIFSPEYLNILYITILGRVIMTCSLISIIYAIFLFEKILNIEI